MNPTQLQHLLIPMPRTMRTLASEGPSSTSLRRSFRALGLAPHAWQSPGSCDNINLRFTHDSARPPGAYRIRCDSTRIEIARSDDEGARNALATLKQLAHASESLPALEIQDAPAFQHRGVMLDVSRLRVPTMLELHSIIDTLASLKINHLQFYIEHAFLYRGHEEVSAGSSPLTPAELARLDRFARARGITLAANQNCFGHLTRWLQLPRYNSLAETNGDWDFLGMPQHGPFTLCPQDPASLALVDDLIAQQLACVSSKLINIGCDETYDLGQGRSANLVAQHGRASVYGSFVAKICQAAHRHGGRPMFWADIALEHPETLDLLPDDAIALAWGYEPDAAFAQWCHTCQAHGHQVWVCPGTSSWRSIIGRTDERRANVARAVREGLQSHAAGLMICDWGDAGHLQQWPIALHAIAHAAAAAWTGDTKGDIAEAESLQLFNDRTGAISHWLDRLGNADLHLRQAMKQVRDGLPLLNASALFTVLWPARGGYQFPPDVQPWWEALEHLAILEAELPAERSTRVGDELQHTLRLARFAAEVGAWRHAHQDRPMELEQRLDELQSDHRRLWLVRSRRGGLEESAAAFDKLRASIL